MGWRHFVAYAVFIVGAVVWVQHERARGRVTAALGVVGLFVVLWLVLQFAT